MHGNVHYSFTTHRTPSFQFCGATITTVTSFRYLGVLIDNKLTWGPHVNKATTKALRRLQDIRKFAVLFGAHIPLSFIDSFLGQFYPSCITHLRSGLVSFLLEDPAAPLSESFVWWEFLHVDFFALHPWK